MHDLTRSLVPLLLLLASARDLPSQEPTVTGAGNATAAALKASKEDPAAADRGSKLYLANCSGCHGPSARGGVGAPDLLRSLLVLDDEKGILISPVLRNGRPDEGMPKPNLTEAQIADIVAWLHVQTYSAGHRTTYAFQDVLTGDAKKGEVYFNATCKGCHSATGDLAGIGKRYDAFALQAKGLQPRAGRGEKRARRRKAPSWCPWPPARAGRSKAFSIVSTTSASPSTIRAAIITPSR